TAGQQGHAGSGEILGGTPDDLVDARHCGTSLCRLVFTTDLSVSRGIGEYSMAFYEPIPSRASRGSTAPIPAAWLPARGGAGFGDEGARSSRSRAAARAAGRRAGDGANRRQRFYRAVLRKHAAGGPGVFRAGEHRAGGTVPEALAARRAASGRKHQ